MASFYDSLKNKVHNAYTSTVSNLVAPPTESKFAEKGVLTPKEFILAGDQLTNMCPTWSWRSAVDDKHKKSDLPDNKQFLYTKVPCQTRVKEGLEAKTIEKDMGDGWFMAETECDKDNEGKAVVKKLDAMNLEDLQGNKEAKTEDKYVDEDDDDGIQVKVSTKVEEENKEDEDDFVQVTTAGGSERRFYELTITYDFYYLTPRFWLAGYTEDNNPLSAQEMFEDIMDDYANKTVTYEMHPHLGVNQLSIHPCKHANVMKHLIDVASDNEKKIEPHQAMFFFLKFISSIVPTIEYDFTQDV